MEQNKSYVFESCVEKQVKFEKLKKKDKNYGIVLNKTNIVKKGLRQTLNEYKKIIQNL
ncbi:MAG: hypothetical protein ACYDDE_03930 [bacterium]